MFKYLLAAAAALILAAPNAAAAQDDRSYVAASADETIRGRIASFDGDYSLQVRDERGYVDNVRLHQGTIINPTGLTLEPGMVVSILGFADGSAFDANEIDTPYRFVGDAPYYEGHPWGYYGPSIGLAFFFGNPGWTHGSYAHEEYRYEGARGVAGYRSDTVYRAAPEPHGYVEGRVVAPVVEHAGSYGYRRPTYDVAPAPRPIVRYDDRAFHAPGPAPARAIVRAPVVVHATVHVDAHDHDHEH